MNEYHIIGWSVLNTLVVLATATLYALGGRSNKWLRRFAAPAVLVGYCAASAGWIALLSYPLYAAAYSLGYGESSFLAKWLRSKLIVRAVTGACYTIAALPIAVAYGVPASTFVFFATIAAASAWHITAFNPLKAAAEEYLVAFSTTFFVPFLRFAAVLVLAVGVSGAAWAAAPFPFNCKNFDECMESSTSIAYPVHEQTLAATRAVAFKLDEIAGKLTVLETRVYDGGVAAKEK